MATYQTPGVYREDVALPPRARLLTGVPVFLGYVSVDRRNPPVVETPQALTRWLEYEQSFGSAPQDYFLGLAVRGFFDNGGQFCFVVPLDRELAGVEALARGLAAIEPLTTVDLVCAPDIVRRGDVSAPPSRDQRRAMQRLVLDHCERLDDRLAVLDAWPGVGIDDVQVQRTGLSSRNGALYYPWIDVLDPDTQATVLAPPCGHVAGVYAATDQAVGVHKAPANVELNGVLDLEVRLTDVQQAELNPIGINCLRAFAGRGIRVWGARTLSDDPAWIYISVRRLFLTAGRWIAQNLSPVTFEPNDARLWTRITRELTAYFEELFDRGALRGATAQQAFYVKCDADVNPPEVRDLGQVIVEIGLAPALPEEYVVVRITAGPTGVTISGP